MLAKRNTVERIASAVLVLAMLIGLPTAQAAEVADRIFINGKVWTANESQPYAEAFAILGDKFLAVGSTQEIRKLAGAETQIIDLRGQLVVPGFQDSHLHFPGPSTRSLALDGIESLAELQKTIADFAAAYPDLPWITGMGWAYSAFPEQIPDKKYLDAVVPDRPVYIVARDGHMGLANSKALELAGISRATPDPPNGTLARTASGDITGELKESAQYLLRAKIPPRSEEDVYQSFVAHMKAAAAKGLTAAHNASWDARDQPVYERALAAGEFRLRLHFAPPILPNIGGSPRGPKLTRRLQPADLAEYQRLRETYQGPLMSFGSIKGMLDGTVDAKTAAMLAPYVGGGRGLPFWNQQDLNATVALYDKEGYQLLLHAIGDKAIDMALNAFEFAAKTNGTSGRRHRIEHVEVPTSAQIQRFKSLGVVASMQALFAMPDATVLTNYAVVLGPERSQRANAFKQFDDAGVIIAFGSDWNVFDYDPLRGIYTAVTRLTPEGTPIGGWYPENRISVESALRHYTRNGAFASFDDDVRGTIAPGKLADFVQLSRDILTIDPLEIRNTKVLRTVMGGRETFRDRELATPPDSNSAVTR